MCLGCEAEKKPGCAKKKNVSRAAWRARKKAEAAEKGVEWHETDPAKMRAYRISWLERNPDWRLPEASIQRQKETALAYVLANKAKVAERKKKWYAANKERISEEFKAKYAAAPDIYREKRREHSRNNPIYRRAENQRRRALKQQADGHFSVMDVANMLATQDEKCAVCSADISSGFHIDHKVPLIRGGSNWPFNLQILCPTCNLKKGSLTMDEWTERQGSR